MNDFKAFLYKLGGLHDASIINIEIDIASGIFIIGILDIYENFKGRPEYPGPKAASIKLKGISECRISVPIEDLQLNVYDFSASPLEGNGGDIRITFWPEGSITMKCKSAEFPSEV